MLITLAIIGIVAALTIPPLISSYKKHAVETKLKQFYSSMNQAVKLSEIDNGSISTWELRPIEDFYNRYFSKYIKAIKVESYVGSESGLYVYLSNGTVMRVYGEESYPHILFFTDARDVENPVFGKNAFLFMFLPSDGQKLDVDNFCNSPFRGNAGIDAYVWSMNGPYDSVNNCRVVNWPDDENYQSFLMNASHYGCAGKGHYCTALIKMNNWKIPKDYPVKF